MTRALPRIASTILSALLLVCAVVFTPASASASKEEAAKFVDSLAKDVITMIGDEKLSKSAKRERLESIFEQYVDIDWIAQFALGKNWKEATDEQKSKYLASYRKFLVLNYTSNFENFADTRFDIAKTEEGNKPGEYIIGMVLQRDGQQDIAVDYRLKEEGKGKYKVIDIIAEGISLITSQRSEFGSVVSRNGLDYLIEQLATKTVEQKN